MNEEYLDTLKAFIEEQSSTWVKEYIAQRKAFLARRNIKASEELIKSFEWDVNRQVQNNAVTILLGFSEHGRYIDMKRLDVPGGGEDYVARMIDWMERKGIADNVIPNWINKFSANGVPLRKVRKVPEKVLIYAAWGLINARQKAYETGKFKRKAWYNKSKTAGIRDLYNQVAGGLPQIVQEQITEQFKNGSR